MNIADIGLLAFGIPASVGMLWASWIVGREEAREKRDRLALATAPRDVNDKPLFVGDVVDVDTGDPDGFGTVGTVIQVTDDGRLEVDTGGRYPIWTVGDETMKMPKVPGTSRSI